MNYFDRISTALNKLPDNVAIKIGTDIDKRISDWLAAGGKEDDGYIMQQVIYAESAAKVYEKKE
ncbi:DUF6877 family protein [Marinilactibacillus psychrotolerans]|uniref:DUF6877 family protein n=1 Tax=Marinilactibacillus psychrotolerans TaxID=191770 RepID=UPI00388975C6